MANLAHADDAEIRQAVEILSDKDVANDAQAAQIMLREAEAGALDAQAYMVYLYESGIGVSRDTAAAAHWETRLGAVTGNDWDKAYAALLHRPKDINAAVKDGTVTEWARSTHRRSWALLRITKHAERRVREGDAELRRLTRQHDETNRQLAAAIDAYLVQSQAATKLSSNIEMIKQLQAATTPSSNAMTSPQPQAVTTPSSDAMTSPQPQAAKTPSPDPMTSTMQSLQSRALAGDTGAALAYAKGWHEGAGVPRNDMACYFWTGMDPHSAKSMELADACDDALSVEQKQDLRVGAGRLLRGGALRTPPRDPESAVADFNAWMTVVERLVFSGTRRDQLRERHYYGWALPTMYRYGLATDNTALLAALCGPQSCGGAEAAMLIVVRSWEALHLPQSQEH